MTDPNRYHIDTAIEDALDRAFEQIYKRIEEEYVTEDAAAALIQLGWGEEVGDMWTDWVAEYTE